MLFSVLMIMFHININVKPAVFNLNQKTDIAYKTEILMEADME